MSVLKEKLPESLEKVREFLTKHPKLKGCEVDIYAWPETEKYGIRVAEVDYVIRRKDGGCSGGSWMQSDPGCGNVCFYAERLALEYSDSSDVEEIQDAEWRLVYAMFGEEA